MRQLSRAAVIVSTARTPIGKAYRGAFNDTQVQTLIGHAVSNAVSRAGLEGAEVEDCIIGAALRQGSSGFNIARQAVIRAGLPVTVAGMSVDRQCASGMMAIAAAARQVLHDGMSIAVGGGIEKRQSGTDRQDERLSRRRSVDRRTQAGALHVDPRNR